METLLGQRWSIYGRALLSVHTIRIRVTPGEIPELKKECECRKPKAGMLFEAAMDFNIDLHHSFMVGDSETDVQCGINGGCTSILLTENTADVEHYRSLLDFVEQRIEK